MRQHIRQKLAAMFDDEVIDIESEQDMDKLGRRLMVDRFGASCAGWLVFEHRAQLRRAGAIDLRIARRALSRLPMWFALAVKFLERSMGFEVARREEKHAVVWRVKWKSRGYWRELLGRMRAPN